MSAPKRAESLGEFLGWAAMLGACFGIIEVGVRMHPRFGFDRWELLQWLAVAALLNGLFGLGAGLAAWLVRWRRMGLVWAAMVALHGVLFWRFELYLNEFVRDPRVWGGIAAITLASLGLGLLLGGILRQHHAVVGGGALALALCAALWANVRHDTHCDASGGDRPDVLLITVDTTRADRLEIYGGPAPTPHLARLAAEGVVFDQAIATAPLTEPAHLAILSGLPPHVSGLVSNGTAIGGRPHLLSRVLQDRGYHTGAFVSGFPLHARYGWDQGWHVYDDDFGVLRGLHRLSLVKAWDQLTLPGNTLRERRGDHTVDRALHWLPPVEEGPVLMWVHLFDPHAPYAAPDGPADPPTEGAALPLPTHWPPAHQKITSVDWLHDAYDAEITWTDAQIGRVLAALERRGRWDQTVAVVVADHGESLTEHGYYFDHGDRLWDPSLRIPMMIRAPGLGTKSGTRVAEQVSQADVTPTLLSLLGIDDGLERTGVDRSPLLNGGQGAVQPVVATTIGGRFVANPPVDMAARWPHLKVLRSGTPDQEPVCFDLVADPGEDQPLPCTPAQLQAAEQAWSDAVPALSPELTGSTVDALRALGYLE